MTKRSVAPFLLGGCGCFSILIALVLLTAWYFVPDLSSWNMAQTLGTDAGVAHYVNSPVGRSGSLAENYVGLPYGW